MRIVKSIAKILGLLLLFLLVAFGSVTYYVYRHQEQLLRYVVSELTGKLNGELTIGQTNPDFFRTFPHACITLHNVSLTDSLYLVHKRALLHAGIVRVTVNLFSLLRHQPQIREVSLSKGTIYWYTDSNGYSNRSVLMGKYDSSGKKLHIKKVLLSEMELISDNQQRHKFIHISTHKLYADLHYSDSGWHAKAHFKGFVHQLVLNEAKGSLIRNQPIKGVVVVSGTDAGSLSMARQQITLGKSRLYVMGSLNAGERPAAYTMHVETGNESFDTLLKWITPVTATKLGKVGVSGSFTVNAHVSGHIQYPDTASLRIDWRTGMATVATPLAQFTSCSFSGIYDNGRGNTESMSIGPRLSIYNWQGMWHGIPLRSDSITVTNLKQPIVSGNFGAVFPIEKLRFMLGGTGFAPIKGRVRLRVHVRATTPASGATMEMPMVNGDISLEQYGITYTPRQLHFDGKRATIAIRNNDLVVQQADINASGTQFSFRGQIPGFLSYLFSAPHALRSTWTVESPAINIESLMPLVAVKKVASLPDTALSVPIARQLGKFLSSCAMQISLSSPEVYFKAFRATMVHGNIVLSGAGITASNLTFMHSGGSFLVNGQLTPMGDVSNYRMSVDARLVDIRRFFSTFHDFGQDAINHKQLEGALSASIQVHGGLDANGAVIPHSIIGTAKYDIDNGKLIHFDPILTLGKKIFRRRNLDTVAFRHLTGTLSIQKKVISFPVTFVESSALNLQMNGQYVIGGWGTDIKLAVPLRNPKKDELIENEEIRHKRNMKGIVLHFRAQGQEDGSVKMKWTQGESNDDE